MRAREKFSNTLRDADLGWGDPRPPYQALQGPETYKGLRVDTPGLMRAAHARGLRVDVWTVDEETEMRRLLGLGVDRIMTDRLDLLAGVLDDIGGTVPCGTVPPMPT
jgi:glycerophosphoryl diester phosphodiesterase